MTNTTSPTAVEYDGHTYDLPSVVQPREGDTVEMLTGPRNRRATLRGVVAHDDLGNLLLGDDPLRWDHGAWLKTSPIRIVKRATLPDGIYRTPESSYLWFVKNGKGDTELNKSGELYRQLPVGDDWTRVGDLPVIEVAE